MKLQVEGLSFAFPGRPVLNGIDFAIEAGEFVAVLGTNGTGKTTLLKCVNRILKPTKGGVWLDALAVDEMKAKTLAQKMGYVEQQRQGTRTTVFNAVLLGRKPYLEWDVRKEDLAIANAALDRLGLQDYAMRYLDELSGGELQKVVIARALAQQPNVLLMDEPTSSLDLKNQLEVLRLVHQVTREEGIAALVTMHDLNLALRFADRFLLMKDDAIYAAGDASVLTEETIETVYDVSVSIAMHDGFRFVLPK